MRGKERIAVQPHGICRRLYNFAMAILSSCTLPNRLSQEHPSNTGDIKIEFSETRNGKEKGVGREALQKGKRVKAGSAENDINVKIKLKNRGKQALGVEHGKESFGSEKGKQKQGKESSTQEDGDEDAVVIIPPSRVFTNIDSRADDFIRSRLEAMRRSH